MPQEEKKSLFSIIQQSEKKVFFKRHRLIKGPLDNGGYTHTYSWNVAVLRIDPLSVWTHRTTRSIQNYFYVFYWSAC